MRLTRCKLRAITGAIQPVTLASLDEIGVELRLLSQTLSLSLATELLATVSE